MVKSLNKHIDNLLSLNHLFDAESLKRKSFIIDTISKMKLSKSVKIIEYSDALLFNSAYPSDKNLLQKVEAELARITSFLKQNRKTTSDFYVNSSLPYTNSISYFTHDFTRWLFAHPDCRISFNKFENSTLELNDVLKFTLPSLERSQTTMGYSNEELFEHFSIKKDDRLRFLLNELSRFDNQPEALITTEDP